MKHTFGYNKELKLPNVSISSRRSFMDLTSAAALALPVLPVETVFAKEELRKNIGVLWHTTQKKAMPATPKFIDQIIESEMMGKMNLAAEKTGIVFVGERHDDFEHHLIQLRVIQSFQKILQKRMNDNEHKDIMLAIGMECFQRQDQKILDLFIQGEASFLDLIKESDWDKNWGYDFLHYAPILLYAKRKGIRILGLHPSNDLVEQVQNKGLASIPSEIIKGVSLSDQTHFERFRRNMPSTSCFDCQDAFEAHIRRSYEVQCFREEYMAESIALHQMEKESGWVISLAGENHVLGRDGIPFRALRRTTAKIPFHRNRGVFTILPKTVQFPVILSGAPGMESADYVWFVERDPSIIFDESSVNLAPRMSL